MRTTSRRRSTGDGEDMHLRQISRRMTTQIGQHTGQFKTHLCRVLFAFAASVAGTSAAHAGNWCEGGVWVDAMLGSYHINPDPDKHFEQFNPGLGVECWLNNQWALTAGGFRNSLRRPSYYGGRGLSAAFFLLG